MSGDDWREGVPDEDVFATVRGFETGRLAPKLAFSG